ncbi:hypothetical protein LA080_002701 [Diaporthe eres]|nr:hypothetical protein LA080_002701 [Diaporthe eres]
MSNYSLQSWKTRNNFGARKKNEGGGSGANKVSQEWHGLPAPPGVTIPSATTIKPICAEAICAEAPERRYPMGLAYPPGE